MNKKMLGKYFVLFLGLPVCSVARQLHLGKQTGFQFQIEKKAFQAAYINVPKKLNCALGIKLAHAFSEQAGLQALEFFLHKQPANRSALEWYLSSAVTSQALNLSSGIGLVKGSKWKTSLGFQSIRFLNGQHSNYLATLSVNFKLKDGRKQILGNPNLLNHAQCSVYEKDTSTELAPSSELQRTDLPTLAQLQKLIPSNRTNLISHCTAVSSEQAGKRIKDCQKTLKERNQSHLALQVEGLISMYERPLIEMCSVLDQECAREVENKLERSAYNTEYVSLYAQRACQESYFEDEQLIDLNDFIGNVRKYNELLENKKEELITALNDEQLVSSEKAFKKLYIENYDPSSIEQMKEDYRAVIEKLKESTHKAHFIARRDLSQFMKRDLKSMLLDINAANFLALKSLWGNLTSEIDATFNSIKSELKASGRNLNKEVKERLKNSVVLYSSASGCVYKVTDLSGRANSLQLLNEKLKALSGGGEGNMNSTPRKRTEVAPVESATISTADSSEGAVIE